MRIPDVRMTSWKPNSLVSSVALASVVGTKEEAVRERLAFYFISSHISVFNIVSFSFENCRAYSSHFLLNFDELVTSDFQILFFPRHLVLTP